MQQSINNKLNNGIIINNNIINCNDNQFIVCDTYNTPDEFFNMAYSNNIFRMTKGITDFIFLKSNDWLKNNLLYRKKLGYWFSKHLRNKNRELSNLYIRFLIKYDNDSKYYIISQKIDNLIKSNPNQENVTRKTQKDFSDNESDSKKNITPKKIFQNENNIVPNRPSKLFINNKNNNIFITTKKLFKKKNNVILNRSNKEDNILKKQKSFQNDIITSKSLFNENDDELNVEKIVNDIINISEEYLYL